MNTEPVTTTVLLEWEASHVQGEAAGEGGGLGPRLLPHRTGDLGMAPDQGGSRVCCDSPVGSHRLVAAMLVSRSRLVE